MYKNIFKHYLKSWKISETLLCIINIISIALFLLQKSYIIPLIIYIYISRYKDLSLVFKINMLLLRNIKIDFALR